MKRKSDAYMNKLIIAGIVVIAVLAGFIVSPYITQKTDTANTLPAYKTGDSTLRTTMPKAIVPAVSSFLSKTLQKHFIPKEIILPKTQPVSGQTGEAYLSSWNIDGQYVTLLVSLTPDNKYINYQRIWIAPPAVSIDKAGAQAMIGKLFDKTYVSSLGDVTCKNLASAANASVTECAGMKTADTGDLYGVTVRAPVDITPPPGVTPLPGQVPQAITVVSACFIPKAGTRVYPSDACI